MSHPGDWRPTAGREALRKRAWLNRLIREFFHERSVLEVETPVLSAHGNSDPNIRSLRTTFDGPITAGTRERWLRTSPEYAHKRLLASGVIGDCYELARVFRDGEAGRRHNPEFTLLEWYRVGWDHHRLMGEVAELATAAMAMVGRTIRVETLSYQELFRRHAGVDALRDTPEALREAMPPEVAIDERGLDRDDWLHLLLTHVIEPKLDASVLTMVHDFPPSQAALARIRDGDPPVAERFEAWLGPLELANGYHELGDATEQRARFEADLARRRGRGEPEPPLDEHLLRALDHGLPPCAGVALGVDRLLMAMLGTADLHDVLAFPFARA